MLILGIDTATKTAATAVVNINDEKPHLITVLSEMQSSGKIPHSENLMPMIDCTLKCAGVGLSEIDLFAAANGPGSFTGIRVGVATVKGLAFGSDANNCIGISSLYSLAYNFYGFRSTSGLILPVIDARRKQVYNAVINSYGLKYVKNDRIITISELEDELNIEFSGYKIIFTGDGADMCYNEIKFDGKIQIPEILKKPSASSLCIAAYNSKPVHARTLAPSYLIKTQAEREKDAIKN